MHVRGSGNDASGPAVTVIDSTTDDGPVTTVRAGDVVLALARVLGAPLGEGVRLIGALADDADDTTVLAVLRT